MRRLGVLEVFLAQVVVYLILWLSNDYVATILTISFAGIFYSIWILSHIVELIEPSKVPKWYFRYMLASALAPTLVGLIFFWLYGAPDWIEL